MVETFNVCITFLRRMCEAKKQTEEGTERNHETDNYVIIFPLVLFHYLNTSIPRPYRRTPTNQHQQFFFDANVPIQDNSHSTRTVCPSSAGSIH